MITMIISPVSGQEKMSYTLSENYGSQSLGNINYFVGQVEAIKYAFKIQTDGFSDHKLNGHLNIYQSSDSTLSKDDNLLYSNKLSVDYYAMDELVIEHKIQPGAHYILGEFVADDTINFVQKSPLLRQRLVIPDFKLSIEKAIAFDYEINDINYGHGFDLSLQFDPGCCYDSTMAINGTIEIYLSGSATKPSNSDLVATLYKDVPLHETIKFEHSESLYSAIGAKRAKYLHVEIKGYVQPGYKEITPIVAVLPTNYCSTIGELNATRRQEYPFLTFTDFNVSPVVLAEIPVDTLLSHGRQYFAYVAKAMQAAVNRQHWEALAYTDSLFAWAGDHPEASVLFARHGVTSDLYNALSSAMKNEKDYDFNKIMNVRLGAAMDMEAMIEDAYNELADQLIPKSLSTADFLDDAGFYEDLSYDSTAVIVQNPILWEEASLPLLNSAMRRFDFETVDVMLTNIDQYAEMHLEAWKVLPAFQEKFGQGVLSGSLVEYHDLLEYYVLKMHFYTETGQYYTGLQAYEVISILLQGKLDWTVDEALISSGQFFEKFGDYGKADSLYQLADAWILKEVEKREDKIQKSKWSLKGSNQFALQAKIGAPIPKGAAKAFYQQLEQVLDKAFVLDKLEYISDRNIAQKLGHLQSDRYTAYYQRNLDNLLDQQQWMMSTDWQKDLSFFLGRDGYTDHALSLYDNLLLMEKIKMRAFRSSFSEEPQVFYAKNALDDFGRFLNLLLEYQKTDIQDSTRNYYLRTAFDQAMDYHSYILRGNYKMLIQVLQSEDESIALQHEAWKAYKQLLNQQYFENEQNQDMIHKIKQNIVRTENELIRNTRDSLEFLSDEVIGFQEIQSQLKPDEVAIEILRIKENSKVYYGNEPKYLAFIVGKDKTAPQLIELSMNGRDMETKFLSRYRKTIKFKIQDPMSYDVYWKDLSVHIPEGTKKVYLVQDGVYQLINPSTLFNTAKNAYLADEYKFHLLPSLSFLNDVQDETFETAAIYGNPVFVDQPTHGVDTSFNTNRSTFFVQEIQSLPGTKDEVNQIYALLKGADISAKLHTGKEVSKSNFFKSENSDIIHMATHGYWTDQKSPSPVFNIYRSMSSSGLVLSEAQTRKDKGFDLNRKGLLTAAEIQNMVSFGTELVVLSACETGLGEVVPGEGIFGLKRAFQKAGVKNLISTLWKVDDVATQQFMTLFYTKLVATNDLDESFNHAASELKKSFSDPYYWGAFTLTHFR